MLPTEFKQLGKHIIGAAGFASNFLLLNESGYFDNASDTKPLLHLWSLGVEEQFYAVWPVLLWASWKKGFHLLTVIIIFAIGSFALNIAGIGSRSEAIFYLPQTRFWELLVGSILAYGALNKRDLYPNFRYRMDKWLGLVIYSQPPMADGKTLRDFQSVAGAVLIVSGLIVLTKGSKFPGWWAVLPTLGTALIIGAGAQAWLNRTVLSFQPLVWVGLISFPLYLWHWPILTFCRLVEGETPTRTIRIAAIFVSFILAALTYWAIEKPVRNKNHQKLKAIVLLVLMIGIASIGYYSYVNGGLGTRFPPIIKNLTELTYDHKLHLREGTCFLRPEQNYESFRECKSSPIENKEKSILLWGDSGAAHLYSGILSTYGQKYNIVQRTSSGCPPILDLDAPERLHCKEINDHIFLEIKKVKPDAIVLGAIWTRYEWRKVEGTIKRLKMLGVENITLVGLVPHWSEGLPRQLFLHFQSSIFHEVPDRMNFGLSPVFIKAEPDISEAFSKFGVRYVAPAKILCNLSGCITRLGDTEDALMAYDAFHLTEQGSQFLVSRFPRIID